MPTRRCWTPLSSFLPPTRIRLAQLLKQSIAEGVLPADLDLDVSMALLVGPMIYRHVLALMGCTLPEDMSQRVVDAFWRAHSLRAVQPRS